MKKIIWNITKNSLAIFWWVSFLVLLLLLNFSTTLWVIWLSWYGSSGDYTSPTSTFSWSVTVWSWETLTWATQVIMTQPVEVTSSNISVIIPSWAEIISSNGGIFNPTEIATSILPSLPIALSNDEQDVGKIQFWISGIKLNFSKPVKLQIPVTTTAGTVKIKAKHAGVSGYQTSALTDNYASTCFNWIATPSSNVASVVAGIATIYTCSASEFVAVVDVVSSSSGGWGGGWSSLSKDNCPSGDFSPSYYDWVCWTAPMISENTIVSDVNTLENTSTDLKDRIKTMKYFSYTISYIPEYKKSDIVIIISKKIILHNKISLSKKKALIEGLNHFLIASYMYDKSAIKTQTLKNEKIQTINNLKKLIQE